MYEKDNKYDPYKKIQDAIEEMEKRDKENRENMPYRLERQTCLHKLCGECHGSGHNRMGGMCLHMISCPCPSCSPTMLMSVQQNKELVQIN